MKKFLLTLSLIFIISMVSIPVFSDGSYVDVANGFNYSITIKTSYDVIFIYQTKKPFFVNNGALYINGDYNRYQIMGSVALTSGIYTSYTHATTYAEIIDSSCDVIDFISRELVYQSEQTDNVVISSAVVDEFRNYCNTAVSRLDLISYILLISCGVFAGLLVIYILWQCIRVFITY